MSDEIRMTLLHHSTNDLIEELLMWRGLAAEHLDRIAVLEAWIDKFIAEGEYLSLLNGLVNGDSDWGNLVADYWKECEE